MFFHSYICLLFFLHNESIVGVDRGGEGGEGGSTGELGGGIGGLSRCKQSIPFLSLSPMS